MHRYALLIVLLLLLCASHGREAKEKAKADETPVPIPVVTVPATVGPLIQRIRVSAEVTPQIDTRLLAETSGTVAQVLCSAGDEVHAGDLLFTLDDTLAQQRLTIARKQLERLEADRAAQQRVGLAPVPESEDVMLLDARRACREQEEALARARVAAPFAGMLADVRVQPGSRVAAGEVLAQVYPRGALRITAQVMQADVPRIRPGADVQVSLFGIAQPIAGRVESVNPYVGEQTGTVVVAAQLPASVAAGMKGTAEITVGSTPGCLLVPRAAVLEREGGKLVFVVQGDHAMWTNVQVGESNERLCQVTEGLLAGQEVVVEGQNLLAHNAFINVVAKEPFPQP